MNNNNTLLPSLWIVSEVYFPEETSTGHYLTLIAENMAKERPVGVICGKPNYSKRGSRVPRKEVHNGVTIMRSMGTAFNKDNILFRLINAVTVSFGIFILLLKHVRRGNLVVVGTNPPTLPFSVAFVCWVKRAECVLKVEDLYPNNMIAAGIISQHGIIASVLSFAQRCLFLRMKEIFVLGRDTAALVKKKVAPRQVRIEWVPNWADSDEIKPEVRADNRLIQELGLQNKFIVGYAGNIGPLQGIEYLFDCALRMREHSDVHFLFVGTGQRCAWLKRAISSAGLKNITLLGQRPRSDQANFLNAFDIAIVSLITGMSGVGVPSRTYNFLAAGKPVLAAVDADSEIAILVNEESVGWVVTPGQADDFVSVILAAKSNPDQLEQIGCRARQLAASKYSFENVMKQYRALLKEGEHSEQTIEPRNER